MKEYIIHISNLFQKYNYDVINYPLFQYAYDTESKITNYKDHLNTFIQNNKPDIILWWFLDVPVSVFTHIKSGNNNIYFIMYNSDDPLNINTETLEKAKIFNLIVTSCKEHINKYKIYSGVTNVKWLPPGYDPEYYFPMINVERSITDIETYSCDISICCYNLLLGNTYRQYVGRFELMTEIADYCKKNKKTFKIFGPFALKEFFPNNYAGDIDYFNMYKIFNYSKINISTHEYCNKSLSITPLEIRILGSGGLLFMDKIKDYKQVFKSDVNCVIFKKNKYITQIDQILSNYDKYENIRNNGYELSKLFTWENFVKTLHIEIMKFHFSPMLYKEFYIDEIKNHKQTFSLAELWDIWLSIGLSNNHICYDFTVPKNFNYKYYAQENKQNLDNIKKLYVNWLKEGKPQEYEVSAVSEKQVKSNNLNIKSLNINAEKLFELYTIFNSIKSYDKTETNKALCNLEIICKNNYGIKINECLEMYFNLCDK